MNLDSEILKLDGSSLKITYREAIVTACTMSIASDEALSGKEKFNLFRLAMRVQDAPAEDAKFTAADIVAIKNRCGKVLNQIAVGRIWEALEPEADSED